MNIIALKKQVSIKYSIVKCVCIFALVIWHANHTFSASLFVVRNMSGCTTSFHIIS